MYNKEGTVVDGIQVRTLYTGFSSDGKYHTNTKPILEPGVYTETVYTLEKKQYKLSLIII